MALLGEGEVSLLQWNLGRVCLLLGAAGAGEVVASVLPAAHAHPGAAGGTHSAGHAGARWGAEPRAAPLHITPLGE